MDTFAISILILEAILFIVCLVLIIYLIFRRVKIKKNENFEDRNN